LQQQIDTLQQSLQQQTDALQRMGTYQQLQEEMVGMHELHEQLKLF
jgi:hypothetical protein